MPFVVKNPKPPDFCGQPPCGICFVWVEDNGTDVPAAVKQLREMLGREPTQEEVAQLEAAQETIHNCNIRARDGLPPDLPHSGGMTFEEIESKEIIERQLNWNLKVRLKEEAYEARRPAYKPSIDELAENEDFLGNLAYEAEKADEARQRAARKRERELLKLAFSGWRYSANHDCNYPDLSKAYIPPNYMSLPEFKKHAEAPPSTDIEHAVYDQWGSKGLAKYRLDLEVAAQLLDAVPASGG